VHPKFKKIHCSWGKNYKQSKEQGTFLDPGPYKHTKDKFASTERKEQESPVQDQAQVEDSFVGSVGTARNTRKSCS
jgi:hypothetical protein